jgi:hypothetical protein
MSVAKITRAHAYEIPTHAITLRFARREAAAGSVRSNSVARQILHALAKWLKASA